MLNLKYIYIIMYSTCIRCINIRIYRCMYTICIYIYRFIVVTPINCNVKDAVPFVRRAERCPACDLGP